MIAVLLIVGCFLLMVMGFPPGGVAGGVLITVVGFYFGRRSVPAEEPVKSRRK